MNLYLNYYNAIISKFLIHYVVAQAKMVQADDWNLD